MIKLNVIILFLFIPIILLFGLACNDSELEVITPKLQLSLDDVGTTESWLKVYSSTPYGKVWILRNNSIPIAVLNSPIDTIIEDIHLLPGQTYTYNAILLNDTPEKPTATVKATMMDTVCCNYFEWELDTISTENYNWPFGVIILNDSSAFVWGKFYNNINDTFYTVIQWNGGTWSKKVSNYGDCDSSAVTIGGFVANQDELWFVSQIGCRTRYFNNTWLPFGTIPVPPTIPFRQLWVKNLDFMVFTPSLESQNLEPNKIIIYQSGSWSEVSVLAKNYLYSPVGGTNNRVGNNVVLFSASNTATTNYKTKIFRYQPDFNHTDEIPWEHTTKNIYSLWYNRNSELFACGDGVFMTRDGHVWENYFADVKATCVAGDGANNVAVVGEDSFIAFYNGIRWRRYTDLPYSFPNFKTVALKDKFILAVGNLPTGETIALRGKRR